MSNEIADYLQITDDTRKNAAAFAEHIETKLRQYDAEAIGAILNGESSDKDLAAWLIAYGAVAWIYRKCDTGHQQATELVQALAGGN